jgi:diacylglycerol kinase (ATP)
MKRRVYVIANPAAGQGTFDIKELNARFVAADIDWEVWFTKKIGDGAILARRAVDEGADVVAAYGGDGTVAEIGGALVGTGIPLAVLPGGTANVMSIELGIPAPFVEACNLLCYEELTLRPVDVGVVGDLYFMLRLSMGMEARMVEGADRNLKDRLGTLAYALSALRALAAPEIIRYEFELDGQTVVEEGIACIIANSANLGRVGIHLSPDVSVSDGLLDVFVVNSANMPTVMTLLTNILGQETKDVVAEEVGSTPPLPRQIRHWQAKEIVVRSTPVSNVQCDGEMIGDTPKHIRILPAAIQVVVPPPPLTTPSVLNVNEREDEGTLIDTVVDALTNTFTDTRT